MSNEKVFKKIREIINRHDPIGIISDDDNPDEYDPEVKEITTKLEKKYTQKELTEEILKIFIKYFTPQIVGDKNKYDLIAKEIMAILE